ncbi:hypothetical protein LRM36_05275 [Stenotrophomonas maltophilia]|nr:hypothetical protein [Stenotrophomonas maltophilia]
MNLEQIDTSTTAGKAEVMRLAAEGRRVACRGRFLPKCEWLNVTTPIWDWSMYDFAIIAEPVGPEEVWVNVIDGDVVMDAYITEQEADAAFNRGWEKVKYIRADLAGERK